MPATTEKPLTLARELAALDRMTAAKLRDRYAAVFGEAAASGNRAWLARRVGWRLQALAEWKSTEMISGYRRPPVMLHDRTRRARTTRDSSDFRPPGDVPPGPTGSRLAVQRWSGGRL